MKKRMSAMIAVCLLICGLAGCGNNQPALQTTSAPETTTQAETTAVPEAAKTDGNVVYDGDGVKISSKGFRNCDEYDGGAMLELDIVNDTGKELCIFPHEASVNKKMYMACPLVVKGKDEFEIGSSFVVPAEKTDFIYGLYLNDVENEEYTLKNIEETSFSLEIIIGDDWENEINTKIFTAENPAADVDYDTIYDDYGDVAYDKDGIKVIIQSTDYDSDFWGPTVNVFAHNDSDKSVEVRVSQATLNGEEHECLSSFEITPGCYLIDELLFEDASDVQPLGTFTAVFEIYEFSSSSDGKLIGRSEPVTAKF
ncbi:MAG: hypothetical protein II820_08790 [Ruminiclostridium sp.]|nr:hypothetical protein [Ruminiclostridium sp.]